MEGRALDGPWVASIKDGGYMIRTAKGVGVAKVDGMAGNPVAEARAALIASAPSLAARVAALEAALGAIAEGECAYAGSAGCNLLPSGVRRSVCDPCRALAALAAK